MTQVRLLIEMRPALDGHFGIPQENRLLFTALARLPHVEVTGLLQTSTKVLEPGIDDSQFDRSENNDIARYYMFSRVVVSIVGEGHADFREKFRQFLRSMICYIVLKLSARIGWPKITLGHFETSLFRDFIWETLFAKTVPPRLRDEVLTNNYRVLRFPWRKMHSTGLRGMRAAAHPRYPIIDTRGISIFIAQTPYPGKLNRYTTMLVRYHDAIPVFMPHTVSDQSFHQSSHYSALKANVRSGAWFACVSESTRRDLLLLFPEVEQRAVTIYNMVSDYYFLSENNSDQIPNIIRTRQLGEHVEKNGKTCYQLSKRFGSEAEKEEFFSRNFSASDKYLLVVATLEPRKNHLRVIQAWSSLQGMVDRNIKLIFLGSIGWNYKPIFDALTPWVERGLAFLLSNVPAEELRVLYRYAATTVCPSLAEGFDFSGVEAMRSGGLVVASDISVHKEVYADAAIYFDPYSPADMAEKIRMIVYGDQDKVKRKWLIERGQIVSENYLPEKIIPQWEELLKRIELEKNTGLHLK